MAVVAEGKRSRIYLPSTAIHEEAATEAAQQIAEHGDDMDLPRQECRGTFASNAQGRRYCFKTFSDYFTPRQLVALTTLSDLVAEAREKVLADARAAGLPADPTRLHEGGSGAAAYADAVATYLGLAVDRSADFGNSITRWSPSNEKVMNLFARQAISMVWDFPEANPLQAVVGGIQPATDFTAECLKITPTVSPAEIHLLNASTNGFCGSPIIVSSDPPYYDNIGYADLSDFFYVWLKRSLSGVWPDLFRRLTTPKTEELVATQYRFPDGETPAWVMVVPDLAAGWPKMHPRDRAEAFFMHGMGDALTAMRKAATDSEPLAIYYAFKQSELAEEGIVSAGWASFLQAIVAAGLSVDGTWPVRSEQSERMIGKGSNALASSIVLVCRKRSEAAQTVTRAEFIRALKREMPEAVDKIRKAGVGPVDMPQSIIGPGMGVFTRYARVLEDDDSLMGVKTALALINRVWGEIENDLDANFDAETQVALAWFATYGFDARASGDLITLANAKNIPSNALFASGVFQNLHGKASLTPREALPKDWSPATDKTPTVWECVQHTARVLRAEDGGAEAAAKLVAAMGSQAEDARALAYRLYEIASQKAWNAEALVYNELAQEWAHLDTLAADFSSGRRGAAPERDLFGEGAR